jgi:hypothetical protein
MYAKSAYNNCSLTKYHSENEFLFKKVKITKNADAVAIWHAIDSAFSNYDTSKFDGFRVLWAEGQGSGKPSLLKVLRTTEELHQNGLSMEYLQM